MSDRELPFNNEDLSVEERVRNLISQLTLEEKISQMQYDAPAIPRLGIPEYNWWNECLHGVGRAGRATVFPQAIGMAATWNDPLIFEIATAISDEARAKHHEYLRRNKRKIYQGLTFWTPNINIFRDPRWGRGQETYGEDPRLTSKMAVRFISGLQGDDDNYLKLIATAKHYAVHSGPESSRHSFDAQISDQDLYDTYLPAFEASVRQANVASIMCAYNRFRNKPCCGSDELLQKILREDWSFRGYVVSDCWAINDFYFPDRHHVVDTKEAAAAYAVDAGTDLNCGNTFPALVEAVEQGLISEEEIDKALYRLFEARFKLGMFDDPSNVKWSHIPFNVVGSAVHRQLALQASREAMVLLKNDNQLLPLSKNLESLAVIGPNANDYQVMLGNYHGTPAHLQTPLDALKEKLPDTKILYAEGCEVADGVPSLKPIGSSSLLASDKNSAAHGLTGRYFDNTAFEGNPSFTQVDETVDFIWMDKTPVSGELGDEFSVRWTGYLVPEVTGDYHLGVNMCNAVKFYLEDSLVIDFHNPHHPTQKTIRRTLEAGRKYKIQLDYYSDGSDPQAHLIWAMPEDDLLEDAIAVAKQAEAVVLFLGLTPHLEGEEMPVEIEGFSGGDRTDIKLPASQLRLIQEMQKTGKPITIVMMGGSAIGFPEAQGMADAVLFAWYPGEFGGQAIADVLFGDYNPAGRLPVTFYQSVDDLPAFDNYEMKDRTYRYFEGVPLYPFGFGLSFTTFEFKNLRANSEIIKQNDIIELKAQITNTGDKAGGEVVQVYVKDLEASTRVPIRSLVDFKRIHLEAGETETVTFNLSTKDFGIVDESGAKIVEPGTFMVSMGGVQPGDFESRSTSGPVLNTTLRFIADEPIIIE